MNGDAAPGFFGKVTTHGDFVGRRLPPQVQAILDAWLQAALLASRDQLGARWLDAYLTAPIWHFALAPGVCDDSAWAGILMPSVDRVGRHFPLALLAPVPGGAALPAWLATAQPWYDAAEALALSSLEQGFDLEAFDIALQALVPAPGAEPAGAGRHEAVGFRLPLAGLDALPAALPELLGAALYGHAIWWTDGAQDVEPCALLCRGLPAPASFGAMLAGSGDGAGMMAAAG